MNDTVTEIIGAVGALSLLLAYFCVTTERWQQTSFAYQGMNLLGASALTVYGVAKLAYANVALNAFWALVAIFGVMTWYKRRSDMRHRKK